MRKSGMIQKTATSGCHDPGAMAPAERLDEVVMLLAAAMLRLRKRRFSRDNCLEVPAETRLSVIVG
jgi:hypothetical protein